MTHHKFDYKVAIIYAVSWKGVVMCLWKDWEYISEIKFSIMWLKAVSSMEERLTTNQEVVGSTPIQPVVKKIHQVFNDNVVKLW